MTTETEFLIEPWRRAHPGGQHVGIESGVRVTHIESGLVVECRTQRSQHRNIQIAKEMIKYGLLEPKP